MSAWNPIKREQRKALKSIRLHDRAARNSRLSKEQRMFHVNRAHNLLHAASLCQCDDQANK